MFNRSVFFCFLKCDTRFQHVSVFIFLISELSFSFSTISVENLVELSRRELASVYAEGYEQQNQAVGQAAEGCLFFVP